MEKFEYYEKVKPLIEQAAEAARRRARRVGKNVHFLWEVYRRERERLHFAAWELKDSETVRPDPHSPVEMTRDEFEEYLLSLGVWVDEPDSD